MTGSIDIAASGDKTVEDWVYGRAFAAAYLISYSLIAVAAAISLVTWSADGLALLFPDLLVLVVLAVVLGRLDPGIVNVRPGPSPYQQGWWQLITGREVGRARRVLRTGRGPLEPLS